MKIFRKSSLILSLLLLFQIVAFAQTTPQFSISPSDIMEFSYISNDNVSILSTLSLKNNDDTRSLTLIFGSEIEGKNGWITFAKPQVVLGPGQSDTVNFTIAIPDNVCEGNYQGIVIAYLYSYDGAVNQGGMSVRLGAGRKLSFKIESGKVCTVPENLPGLSEPDGSPNSGTSIMVNVNSRVVFYDLGGDGNYEPGAGDYLITKGLVKLYDMNNNLLKTTDLAQSGGFYEVSDTTLNSAQNLYFTVVTNSLVNGVADRSKKENIFVDRTGNASSLNNVFQLSNVSSFAQINSPIDIRSRNTDRLGLWENNTLSIGPDDKDQIISPNRWDKLVANTDFRHADLDHDGRVDPDDKDHVISPVYWDFPN